MKKNMPRVLAINDISSVGKCSLTVIIPILSALGIEVCPVVTAVLSAHTGFPKPYIVDLTEHIKPAFEHISSLSMDFDFVFSGYLGSNPQIEIVEENILRFKKNNTKILIDPVLGDNGKLYSKFDDVSIKSMIKLCKTADIITPNFTEACLLSGFPYKESISEAEVISIIQELRDKIGDKSFVITGLTLCYKKVIVIFEDQLKIIETDYAKGQYCGTGDAFASILCGCLINGKPLVDAVIFAHNFLRDVIEETYNLGGTWEQGILLEKFLYRLCEDK